MHGPPCPPVSLATATRMVSGTQGWAFQDDSIHNRRAGCSRVRLGVAMTVGMSRPTPGNLWTMMILGCEIHGVRRAWELDYSVLSVFVCVGTAKHSACRAVAVVMH